MNSTDLKRRGILVATLVAVILVFSLLPVESAMTFGRWRDINPTQYSADVLSTLRGVYMYRSGGSAVIGSGDGWAVGGDGANGIIAHYDGFSWQILGSPAGASAVYNSAHFCLAPGAPNVGSVCTPYTKNGYVADGWLVGTIGGTSPVATYWDGSALTEHHEGLAAAGNLTSVFMVCNSPETGQLGCSGTFQSYGLTYAVGSDSAGTHGIICNFNGDPKAGGSWVCPFVSGTATRYNGVYMYVDPSGNLGGFAVGNNGVIARLIGGAWIDSVIAPGPPATIFRSVFVDQGGNNLEAWAVGDYISTSGSQVWHFCCGPAGSWTGTVAPGATTQSLESVFLVSTTEGWAVGTQSVILHSTTLGTSNQWLALTSAGQTGTGAGVNLFGLSFPSGGNGWAVGSSGVILDTQNSNCGNSIQSPCWGGNTAITQTYNLTSVFEIGQNDAWAGGWWDFANNRPTLNHWDGTKWHQAQIAPPPSLGGNPYNITSIYMSGSSDGWAVGGKACAPPGTIPCTVTAPQVPFALHWDGNSWTGSSTSQPTCPGGCSLTSVFMINSGEGWAVGTGGNFFHYTTSVNQWGLVAGPPTTATFNSIFISNPGSNPNAGWAVGNGGVVAELSISGSTATWNLVTIPALGGATPNLYGVFFTDANHGWIVGAQGTILITTNGGQGWSGGLGQVVGAPTSALRSVYIDNPSTGPGNGDGWAVGAASESGTANAVFAHWDGQIWTATTISPPIAAGLGLNSVYGQPGNTQDGWAVGTGPSGVSKPLAGIFHLDPLNPPTQQPVQYTTTVVVTSSISTVPITTSSVTSSVASTGSSQATTVTTASTTTQVSTSISTSVVSTTAVVTQTVTTASVTTPVTLPGIPGFPWESIIAGIVIGIALLGIARRNKRNSR